MATSTGNSARLQHVSPGVYTKETELNYASRSLGITTLGLVGETLKGPAFQPISISNWREYQQYFGGTSTEVFKGSKRPKYELPYIAKSYLQESQQLQVVKVLGISGLNAGPAWVITADKVKKANANDTTNGHAGFTYNVKGNDATLNQDGTVLKPVTEDDITVHNANLDPIGTNNKMVVAVLRSRAEHRAATFVQSADPVNGICEDKYEFDKIIYYAKDVKIMPSKSLELNPICDPVFAGKDGTLAIDSSNYGTFTLVVTTYQNEIKYFSVSLNPGSKNHILNILGTDPNEDGAAEIYVEELYDVPLIELVDRGVVNELTWKPVVFQGNSTKQLAGDIAAQATLPDVSKVPDAAGDDPLKPKTDLLASTDPTKYKNKSLVASDLAFFPGVRVIPSHAAVVDLLTKDESELSRRDVGKRFLFSSTESVNKGPNSKGQIVTKRLTIHVSEDKGITWDKQFGKNGHIYTVVPFTERDGSRHYYYGEYVKKSDGSLVYDYDDRNNFPNDFVSSDNPVGTHHIGDFKDPANKLGGGADTSAYYAGTIGIASLDDDQTDAIIAKIEKANVEQFAANDDEERGSKFYTEKLLDKSGLQHEKYEAVYGAAADGQNDDKVAAEAVGIYSQAGYVGQFYADPNQPGIVSTYSDVVEVEADGFFYINDHRAVAANYAATANLTAGQAGVTLAVAGIAGVPKVGEIVKSKDGKLFPIKAVNLTDADATKHTVDLGDEINANDAQDVYPITFDANDYKEQYRPAITPWIVSELKGSAENVELSKLFRFTTISDGNTANTQVKVSIQNIDPDAGTFDVLVRDFYDTDAAPQVYERFTQVNLKPGTSNYIGLMIGTTDGQYDTKSQYITVEVNESELTEVSTPSGFLGYPVRNYGGEYVTSHDIVSADMPTKPHMIYNADVYDDIKIRKQYFGISDITGYDADFFSYKGKQAYNDLPQSLTPGFHLDSRIIQGHPDSEDDYRVIDASGNKQKVTVDRIPGYEWVTVGKSNTTLFGIEPRIGTAEQMEGTIYEDKNYRKFTLCFYGGWDGWDYYRASRSTQDDFQWVRYKGTIDKTTGEGVNFSVIKNPSAYELPDLPKSITSDWYAFLSGARQFANPKNIDINVLATPGINYVDDTSLVGEIIEMVEQERADSIYVATTPDKPYGAGDSESEMYSAEDAVANLEDSEIDSNYTCTYYPDVKYFDQDNNQYIYLPITRDVVRNFAYTDNTAFPWFAAAGWNRGTINGIRPKKILKLDEQDTLYAGRINFANSFAGEMKVWGDKNLQVHESQMNRISKRRLLLHIRKLLAIAAIQLIFDPNDNTTKQSFESAVTPVLDKVMSNRGITDYRLEVDDSQEARDRLELPAKIYLKPQPNLEYITIDFIITPSGVNFDDI